MSVANFKDTWVGAFVFLKQSFIPINLIFYNLVYINLPYLDGLDKRLALSMGNFLCQAYAVFPAGVHRPRVCPAENTHIRLSIL